MRCRDYTGFSRDYRYMGITENRKGATRKNAVDDSHATTTVGPSLLQSKILGCCLHQT